MSYITSYYISAQAPSETSQHCFSHLVHSCWKPFGAPSMIRNTVCLCNLKLLWSICSLLFSCQHCPLAEVLLSLSSASPPLPTPALFGEHNDLLLCSTVRAAVKVLTQCYKSQNCRMVWDRRDLYRPSGSSPHLALAWAPSNFSVG